jgi:hypothetical protein
VPGAKCPVPRTGAGAGAECQVPGARCWCAVLGAGAGCRCCCRVPGVRWRVLSAARACAHSDVLCSCSVLRTVLIGRVRVAGIKLVDNTMRDRDLAANGDARHLQAAMCTAPSHGDRSDLAPRCRTGTEHPHVLLGTAQAPGTRHFALSAALAPGTWHSAPPSTWHPEPHLAPGTRHPAPHLAPGTWHPAL